MNWNPRRTIRTLRRELDFYKDYKDAYEKLKDRHNTLAADIITVYPQLRGDTPNAYGWRGINTEKLTAAATFARAAQDDKQAAQALKELRTPAAGTYNA